MLKSKEQLKNGFLEIGQQCINQHYHAYTQEDITKFICDVVIKENDPMADERKNFVRQKLKINYPNVSDFVISYLKKQLNIEEGKK